MSKPRTLPLLTGVLCAAVLTGLLAGCSGSARVAQAPAASDPSVVATIGREVLTVDGFEERYARTVGTREAAADDSLGAYQEFLDRYVNFRLKVLAAQAAGLDTTQQIRQEIVNYRTNLARPYLLEQEVLDPIIRDLYKKQQEIVDVSHILLRLEPDAAPADTLAAYQRLQALADSVAAGTDFGALALRHSEDPSARGREGAPGYRGHLGFISAGRVVEEFEDRMYATPVGAVSPVFRTQFGYHILQVHGRQPAVDDIHIAHIMVRAGQTAQDSAAAQAKIRDLQQRVAAGEDFAALAKQFSDDRGSAENGGDLNVVSYDMPIVEPFKSTAFALQTPGQVSDVVETRFGYHLVKLLERKPKKTFEEAYTDLKQAAARMPRAKKAEQALGREILASRGATVDSAAVLAAVAGVPADSVIVRLAERNLAPGSLDRVFFTLGDSSYTIGDLAAFAPQAQFARRATTREQVNDFIDQFTTLRAIDYEAATLETRDDEFRTVMEDFRDGLVLFKLMEDSVWTAAERDSLGLLAHYEANRAQYNWPERTRIVGLHSRSDSTLQALAQRLDAGTPLAALVAEVAADTLRPVRVDTVLAAGQTGSLYDQALALAPGAHTAPVQNRGSFVLLVNDGTLPAGPKTFAEARAEVVSQHQQVLEEALLARLRRRFGAQTHPERLTEAFAGEKPAAASASVR